MKVVHLSSAHLKNDIRICIKECQSLVKSSYDVSFVVWGQEEEVINGVKIVNSGERRGSRYKRFLLGAREVYKKGLSINADVYHVHDPELLYYAYKLKRKGYKVIYDVHEGVADQIMSKYWIPASLREFVSKAFTVFENKCAKRLDAIITATTHISKEFTDFHSNVTVINNYPLFGDIEPSTPWEDKEKSISYAGGITEIRGIIPLVKAVQLSNTPLKLAGSYRPATLKDTVQSIDSKGLVDYKGMVDREALNDMLNTSKIGIVTFLPAANHISAQPNKMFEYMAAGIPVICSHFELWKEIIDFAKCGLYVDPTSAEELSVAINKILGDDSLAKQMGENGRKAVLSTYNWNQEENKLLAVYSDLSA